MSNINIDYEAIVEKITGQLLACRNSDPIFKPLELKVENERQFAVEEEMKPNTIYVVLHYGESSTNFGQLILPVDFRILSEKNKIELVQKLFLVYTSTYNMNRSGTIAQFYTTPVVDSAFTEVKSGYRASLSFSGAFLIGTASGDYVAEIDYDGEPIEFLDYREGYRNDLRPQPYPDGKGFALSVSGYATHTFTVTTYLTTSKFCKKLNDLRYGENNEDTSFSFTLKLYSGSGFTNRKYHCMSIDVGQKIGETTLVTASFSL